MAATEVYAAYEYVCGQGHAMAGSKPLKQCPVAVCKHPQLKRVGHGSRKEAKAGAA